MYNTKKVLTAGFASVVVLSLSLSNVAIAKESSPLDQ